MATCFKKSRFVSCLTAQHFGVHVATGFKKCRLVSCLGNRLLNWPKLLRFYADGFYSIFVPECVPYIIPHMFQ